jgi:hypothetical protein
MDEGSRRKDELILTGERREHRGIFIPFSVLSVLSCSQFPRRKADRMNRIYRIGTYGLFSSATPRLCASHEAK